MSRSKPAVRKLHELKPGEMADFFAVLSEREKRATRDGKPFYSCKFRDGRRAATCMVWSDDARFAECEGEWRPGLFFKIRATYGEHPQFGPKLDIHNLRIALDADRADGFVESELIDCSRYSPDEMLTELCDLAVESIVDEPLRKLVLNVLEANAAKIKMLPASPRNYYPFPGGWLEHTLSVTKKCWFLTERYREQNADLTPPLNRDLVMAGAMLHEIGRVAELQPGLAPNEPAEQTVPGRLFGHLALGRDLVREAARQIPELNAQLLQLLEHVLLSYLTLPEWGSPRLPMIPEVLILHHADDLDAKMEMYTRCLRKDVAPGPFTERDPILGKPLLKAREV